MGPTLRTVAHEAGHAVAVYLHGGDISWVSALPDDRQGGHVAWRHDDGCSSCEPIAAAIIALAGPLTSAAYVGERGNLPAGDGTDLDQFDHAVGEMAHSPLESAALAAWLHVRARAFVRTPRFRALATHLVKLLTAHGELAGDTVTAELERASALFDQIYRGGSAAVWESIKPMQ